MEERHGTSFSFSDPDHDPGPVSDDEYYSEDFEQDVDGVEVIQEIEVPQSLPSRSRPQKDFADEASSEEAIVVYKSANGPRLTIQPKKPRRRVTSQSSVHRTHSRTSAKGNKLLVRKNTPYPPRKNFPPRDDTNNPGNSLAMRLARSEESIMHELPLEDGDVIIHSPRCVKTVQGCSSTSRCRMNSYKVTTTTVCTGPTGNRKVPGSSNLTNRNYCKEKRYITPATPYPPGYHPPMKVGPAKGTITQRLASAKKIAINDLKNRISLLVKDVETLTKENRCLKVLQNRQALALKRWEGRDAELPKLLQQHKDEIKTTHMQLKKAITQCRELEEKMRVKDRRIGKLENDLQNLRALAERDDLKERAELQEQVDLLSANVAGCEKKIRQYMRHIEIIESNHKHQITAEKQKLIKANNHALELRQEITSLKVALRDKDRMLNYIQMRSTGRNLLKSFQEKERQNQSKLLPFSQSQTPRSRSVTPKKNPVSGRSFRSRSVEVNKSTAGAAGDTAEIPLESQTSSDFHQVSINSFSHAATSPKTKDAANDTNDDDGSLNVSLANVSSPESSIDNRSRNHQQRQQFQNQSPQNTKLDYYEMSQMFSKENSTVTYVPSKSIKSRENVSKPQPQPSKNNRQHELPSTISSSSNTAKSPIIGVSAVTQKMIARRQETENKPIVPAAMMSPGPKTHSDAKREMKRITQSTELIASNKKKAHLEEVQKKKWEKCVKQHNNRPVPQIAAKVPSSSSQNVAGFNPKFTETTVKVRSPRGKNQPRIHEVQVNKARKGESTGTVEVCVQIKKNAGAQAQYTECSPTDDIYEEDLLSSSGSESSQNESADEEEFPVEGENNGNGPAPLESLVVPPPPGNFSLADEIFIPPLDQPIPSGLTPREKAEITAHEIEMANFIARNGHKLGTANGGLGTSFSSPEFSSSPRPRQFEQFETSHPAQCVTDSGREYHREFFNLANNSPRPLNPFSGPAIVVSGIPVQNSQQGIMHLSPRSDVGPSGSDRGHFGLHQQYQHQPYAASARPDVPYPRGVSSYPQVTPMFHQVQETYSYPLMNQPQQRQTIPIPESRMLFSYSEPVPVYEDRGQPQHMHVPYFTGPSAEMGDMINPHQNFPMKPQKEAVVRKPVSRPKPKRINKNSTSHYDPSFFAKLGAWK